MGLYTRGYFENALISAERVYRDSQTPFAVIMLDIDHFKNFNDRHSYAVGDAVLAHVGRAITDTGLSVDDVEARVGGEEVKILCPDTDLQGAIRRAERIRACLADRPLELGGQRFEIKVTVAVVERNQAENIEQLGANLDALLHQGKLTGRDRTVAKHHGIINRVAVTDDQVVFSRISPVVQLDKRQSDRRQDVLDAVAFAINRAVTSMTGENSGRARFIACRNEMLRLLCIAKQIQIYTRQQAEWVAIDAPDVLDLGSDTGADQFNVLERQLEYPDEAGSLITGNQFTVPEQQPLVLVPWQPGAFAFRLDDLIIVVPPKQAV